MPYNTRRKSLSLPSLGIHVPVTHAARAAAAHRASPNQAHQNTSGASPSTPSHASTSSSHRHHPAPDADMDVDASSTPSHRPSKRTKRSHDTEAHSSTSTSSTLKPSANAAVTTPPPSPKPVRHASVDMEDASDAAAVAPARTSHRGEIDMNAVNDDIVEAVILQIRSTGNRPHLVKELSSILMLRLKAVQQSANPCAIISSRLASYMKRPCWSASSPCPLAKELESVHPRRTYYFITTYPHQPIPDASSSAFIAPRTSISIVTPPLSSAASGSESIEEERRRELSPSPEVDLSSPEFDDFDDEIPMPGTPIGSFSVRFPRISSGYGRNHRGASPPLEKDEKEFTQTAEGLQKRKLAGNTFLLSSSPDVPIVQTVETDESSRDESLLFASDSRHLFVSHGNVLHMTSPAMRPLSALGMKKDQPESEGWAKLGNMLDWDRCPENIELDELDGLLDDF